MANLTLRDMAVSRDTKAINPMIQSRLNQANDGETIGITADVDMSAEMLTDQQFIEDCGDALQDPDYAADTRSKILTARTERHAKLFKALSEAIAKQQNELTKALRTFKPQWSFAVKRTEKTRAVRKSDGSLQLPCFDIDVTAVHVKDVQTEVEALIAARKSKAS